VLEERVGTATTADRKYVWGLRYVDEMILRDRDTGSGNERLYCMQDDNWNVVAICDTSAAVQERYAYTPYGMVSFLDPSFGSIGSSAFSWNYLFTGRERDTESALQLNRNRYYHARLGCWITRDPMGYAARDTNLYRYVVNQPCDRFDPSGKDPLLMLMEWLFRPEPPPVATGKYWICMKPVDVTGLGSLEAFFAQTSSAQHTGIGVGSCDSIVTIREGRGGNGACGPLNIPCSITVATNGTLKSGIGAGVSCRCATDAQIQSCVAVHPKLPGPFNHFTNNCQTDVANTARACCLLIGNCYLPADTLRQWLLLQAEPQYWMSS
jgi:RHS repeat-associated protein